MSRFLAFSTIALACAACIPAAAPAVIALGACEAEAASKATSFADFVAQSVLHCGDDMLALLDSLVASKDPAFAKYKAEALEAKRDPAKMDALKVHVALRRAARARGE